MMEQVVRRRFGHDEDFGGMPDLVLIDGGKGQLSSAIAAMRAAGAILQYVRETQPDSLALLSSFRHYSLDEFMTLDGVMQDPGGSEKFERGGWAFKFNRGPEGDKFKLDELVDSFISSCFVHVRKPDAHLFRLALDIAQAPAQQVVYIENTPMFVQIAEGLGIRSILHMDYKSTCAKLASFGLQNDEGVIHETG